MKNKAPLALMEQAVMILVFALAAALCLRVFVWSDRTSRRLQARDQAAVQAQTAAELMKYAGGEPGDAFAAAAQRMGGVCQDGKLQVVYNAQWESQPEAEDYRLEAEEMPSEVPGLEQVRIQVLDGDGGDPLVELQTAWQGEVE